MISAGPTMWLTVFAVNVRCIRFQPELSATSSWSEREDSWEGMRKRKSQNAIRTGAAYLTDRQNALERALRREQLKIAVEEARAEFIESAVSAPPSDWRRRPQKELGLTENG